MVALLPLYMHIMRLIILTREYPQEIDQKSGVFIKAEIQIWLKLPSDF